MLNKNIRRKRFLIENKELLPLHYSHTEEILTLAYDYKDNETRANKDYIEQIQMAIGEFNRFNFAKFIYIPAYDDIEVNPKCPIDERSLRKKYLNRVLFGSLNCSSRELAHASFINSVEQYVDIVKQYLNETITSLPSFSAINGNTADPRFQLLGIGALVHEMFHLFGIMDLVTLDTDCMNGILYLNRTALLACENVTEETAQLTERTCVDDTPANTTNCFLAQYIEQLRPAGCSALINKNLNFTPVSLFSLHLYSQKSIYPYIILNETRITEILNSYQFTSELQKDYFYLLNRYQGQAHLITYQDFSALAQAIYLIAPDSMMGRIFDVPYYYLIKGMYRPLADEEKLSRLIAAFTDAENFTYPILAQTELRLTMLNEIPFTIDLVKKFKVVSLTPFPITCSLEKPTAFKGSLKVSQACVLTGCGEILGNFTLALSLRNDLTEINRFIELTIQEKDQSLNTVLLGKRAVTHLLSEASDLDLAALCHAVSVPEKEDLKCNSFDLSEKLSLANCSVSGINIDDNYNFTVIFFNKVANKTCHVQLWSANISALIHNLIEYTPDFDRDKTFGLSNASNHTSYYARYTQDNYLLNINDTANIVRFRIDNYHYVQQFNYLLTIPLLHGMVEGCIDSIALPHLVRCILKLLPRIGLVSINYLTTLQFPFLFFYSVFESFVGNYLKIRDNVPLRYTVNLILFLLVAELEYGFSNLWLLIDKPQFFPALTERVNQLFVQMLWAPTVKATGYLLAISIMKCCMKSVIQENNISAELGSPLIERETQFQPSCFFNALKLAKDTVFSNKIKRIPHLFYHQFFPATAQQAEQAENDDSYKRVFASQVHRS